MLDNGRVVRVPEYMTVGEKIVVRLPEEVFVARAEEGDEKEEEEEEKEEEEEEVPSRALESHSLCSLFAGRNRKKEINSRKIFTVIYSIYHTTAQTYMRLFTGSCGEGEFRCLSGTSE
jgi:hypothetical protein